MTVLITLTVAGADSGPFNLFSNLDGYTSAFAVGVSKASLLAGYSSSVVPNGTTIIRVMSIGDCTNYIDITLSTLTTTTTSTAVPTTTTTTSSSSTTTTTSTTSLPCDSYEMVGVSDAPGCPGFINYTYTDCLGVVQTGGSFSSSSSETVCAQSTPTITCGSAIITNLGTCIP
jgi:hypothetical protein